jgi:hypothetical protein
MHVTRTVCNYRAWSEMLPVLKSYHGARGDATTSQEMDNFDVSGSRIWRNQNKWREVF